MTGSFVYVDWRTKRATRLRVRECPNPAVARAILEELLGSAVRWEAQRE